MANHSIIKDDGELFHIIPTTRKVMVPPAYLVVGTVGDHNSEQLTFKCPKTIDNHDVVNCSQHYVIWKNVLGETGRTEITNITTDDEYMYFTWVISKGVTAAAGFISFTIHFEDSANGAIAYKWSTTVCKDCQVLETIQVVSDDSGDDSGDGTDSDNTYIPDGYVRPSGTLDINENGEYNVTGYEIARVNAADNVTLHPVSIDTNGEYSPDIGYGYSKAVVNVQPKLQERTVSWNGEVLPGSDYDGLSKVTVQVPEPSGTYAIRMNGEYYIAEYEKVLVQIEGGDEEEDGETEKTELQEKTIRENGTYEPDDEYDGFSAVTVKVPQNVYTGVEYAPGTTHPVYGGVSDAIVIGNYSALISTSETGDGVLYTELNLEQVTTGDSLSSSVGNSTFRFTTEQRTGYVRVAFYQDDSSMGSFRQTYDITRTGFRIKWDAINPPGSSDAFPYGYAQVSIHCQIVDSEGVLQTTGYTKYIGFASEDEYNAAMNLVVEPTTLIKINETVVDFSAE